MKTPANTVTQNAIAANLAALEARLTDAADLARQACDVMSAGKQNEAIGTILALHDVIPEAQALYNAALALHKNRG